MRPRSVLSACEYRPAIAATNSSRAAMLIRLIADPADEHRSGANQMRQWFSFPGAFQARQCARQSELVLIVALAGGRPGPRLRSRAIVARGSEPGPPATASAGPHRRDRDR